jgi:hypothetical protein
MSNLFFDLFFDAEINMDNREEVECFDLEIADFILDFRDEDFAYCDLIHARIDHAVREV